MRILIDFRGRDQQGLCARNGSGQNEGGQCRARQCACFAQHCQFVRGSPKVDALSAERMPKALNKRRCVGFAWT